MAHSHHLMWLLVPIRKPGGVAAKGPTMNGALASVKEATPVDVARSVQMIGSQ